MEAFPSPILGLVLLISLFDASNAFFPQFSTIIKTRWGSEASSKGGLRTAPYCSATTEPAFVGAEEGSARGGSEALVQQLLTIFHGDFDNYEQVVRDREAGMAAGEGGGHEHIHCRLREATALVPPQILRPTGPDANAVTAAIAATYYFDGKPDVVFRFRLYTLEPAAPEAPRDAAVVMRLWRLLPPVEAAMRARKYSLHEVDWEALGAGGIVAEQMRGCEIYWRPARRGNGAATSASSAAAGDSPGKLGPRAQEEVPLAAAPLWEGLMGENDGGTWISSQFAPEVDILVKDDLKLWLDELWVNDRGFGRDGRFVYGNRRGVPYKMHRAAADGPLAWTMGAQHRTEELYAANMAAVGVDVSAPPGTDVAAARAGGTWLNNSRKKL